MKKKCKKSGIENLKIRMKNYKWIRKRDKKSEIIYKQNLMKRLLRERIHALLKWFIKSLSMNNKVFFRTINFKEKMKKDIKIYYQICS